MAGLSLGIKFYWEEQPGDCTPCKVCKEPIYLKKFVGVLECGTDKIELEAALCETCYNMTEDDG
jgi:hypothetical protein